MTRPTSVFHHRIFLAAAATAVLSFPFAGLRAQAQDEMPPMRQNGGMMAGMQRVNGELLAVDGKTLTLKTQDGQNALVVLTENTRIMRGSGMPGMGGPGMGGVRPDPPANSGGSSEDSATRRRPGNMQPVALTDLKKGDGIMAFGMIDPSTKALHAAAVMATDGATLAAMRANLGKTYITGKVTTIDLDNARLTVHRPDGVDQTIGFDESTSFRRGGRRNFGARSEAGTSQQPPQHEEESITLADIKSGDNVFGQGAVKDGLFIPKVLTVSTPGARLHGAPVMPPEGADSTGTSNSK